MSALSGRTGREGTARGPEDGTRGRRTQLYVLISAVTWTGGVRVAGDQPQPVAGRHFENLPGRSPGSLVIKALEFSFWINNNQQNNSKMSYAIHME